MRRPLVSVAISLALGVVAGNAFLIAPAAGLAASAAFLILALLLILVRAAPRWGFIAVLLAVAAAGAAYSASCSAQHRGPGLSALLSPEPRILRVRGLIADALAVEALPAFRNSGRFDHAQGRPEQSRMGGEERLVTRFTLDVTRLLSHGEWFALHGRLRVLVEGRADRLAYGDGVEATLSAWRLSPPGNPGEYDYQAHLDRKGISGVARAPSAESFRSTGETAGFPGLRRVLALKRRMLDALDELVPDRSRRIMKYLLLNEQTTLTEEQQRAFRETGTLHFLAISGQHISLIAVFCWGLLVVLGVRHRPAAVVVMTVVLLYGLVAGFEPSVQRAVVMCLILCGAFLLVRKPDVASSLALALIMVLLCEPADIYSPGCQLSFVAVLGIWLFSVPLERVLFGFPDELDRLQAEEERSWLLHPVRWLLQKTFCLSLAAWLATLPLLAQHFGMIAPVAPVASVILLPAVWLALVAGLPGAFLGPLLGGWAKPLLATAAFGAGFMDWVCRMLDRLPGIGLYVPAPGWAVALLWYAILVAAIFRAELRLTRWRVAALAFIPAVAYLAVVWRQPLPAHLRVDALSVGKGNCVLVRFPNGKTLLFDAGSMGRADVGERVIAPALWSLGVRRLDLVVLSHGDSDHYNGTEELARRIRVGRVAVSYHFERLPEAAALLQKVSGMGADVLRIQAGDRIAGFSDARIEVLWPPRDVPPAKFSDNELSAVVRVQSPDGSVLLTGDFGHGAVGMLSRSVPDLRADVLQVPHHGLADPAAPQLADAVRPKVALIPGGRVSPAAPYYAARSRTLLMTDDCGMITVELIDGNARISTFRRGSGELARRLCGGTQD